MLKSITRSSQFIAVIAVETLKGSNSIPDMSKLTGKTGQELRDLAVTQVWWYDFVTLGFTLNDGQTCEAGA